MHVATTILTLASLLATGLAAPASLNTSREYHLKTCLKPDQPTKERFDNLYLYAYHTGAGLNDATFAKELNVDAAKGFLTPTGRKSPGGHEYSDQLFDLGSSFPYDMIIAEDTVFYAFWQPVRINAGNGSRTDATTANFFIDEHGLEWNNVPGAADSLFNGWITCEWWHGVPQLFYLVGGYNVTSLPSSCANVYLIPEYI